jgi:tRNA pseudouridine32 synthase/23S rRNA pseudouridine746 synthase/23S rRNA pseudouridine1911/1915/1917 synthase
MKFKIEKKATLLEAIAEHQSESSRNTIRSWIQDGRVLVDGQVVQMPKHEVTPGQEVRIDERRVKWQNNVKIVYEDKDLVVVDKPTSLLSVATDFEKKETLHTYLKERYKPHKVFVVHRLDQETSGLIVFARSEQAYRILKDELSRHRVRRVYYALVEGTLRGKGKWEHYLYEDANYYVHITNDPKKGEPSITFYEAISTHQGMTLVRFELKTGKKNQIRVHAQAAGHPIVGDDKYGASMKADRLYLHAHELSFSHPISKKILSFRSALPKKMQNFL